MAKLEHYIPVGQRSLRCGYTTGSCAAAAARGAAERLLSGAWPAAVRLTTPAGIPITADLLSLEALSAKAKDLAERARSNQLGADEYKGSTFTVSNLGMFGVESFTPIINQPDAAILGVNCTEDELVMEADGTIAKHQVMRISLTYDHRLVDGAVAAKFEMTVRDLLESPMDILL